MPKSSLINFFLFADGLDFEPIDVILDFYNETLINISIAILDDAIVEPIEYFTVSIFQDKGDIVFPITEAVVAIIDDDGMYIYKSYFLICHLVF